MILACGRFHCEQWQCLGLLNIWFCLRQFCHILPWTRQRYYSFGDILVTNCHLWRGWGGVGWWIRLTLKWFFSLRVNWSLCLVSSWSLNSAGAVKWHKHCRMMKLSPFYNEVILGWCHLTHLDIMTTLIPPSKMPIYFRLRTLYLCGQLVYAFNDHFMKSHIAL